MKSAIAIFWRAAVVALFAVAPYALGQNDVSITLTSGGGYSDDGIYVSPYFATVNGAANTPVICDDFSDESYVGSTWNANITSFSSLSATSIPTAWGKADGASASTYSLYQEAAWLATQVLQQTPGSQGQILYSYAEWAVFDPKGVANYLDNGGSPSAANIALCNAIFGSGGCASSTVTGGLLATAESSYSSANFSNVFVISPLVTGSTTKVCNAEGGNCPAQEFFMVVPEGGAALGYLALAGISCFGAMLFRSRRQNAGIGIA